MSDAVRALTDELAADPASLAFLELAGVLRQRGQLDAALAVVDNGLTRYPSLADAHALRGRILADLGSGDEAFDAWMTALQLDPSHAGAHKGLGFLYYRSGEHARALRHLEAARERGGEDSGLVAAIERVRAEIQPQAPAPPPSTTQADMPFSLEDPGAPVAPTLFAGLEGAHDGLLLLDHQGMRLGGGLRNDDGEDVSDPVAAHLAGVSREAARAARLLGLGGWLSVAVECADGNLHLVAPTPETVLLTVRDVSVPAGRLALVADRAAQTARQWLEGIA